MGSVSPKQIVAQLNKGVRARNARLRFVARIPFGERLKLHRYALGNGLGVLILVDGTAPVLSYHTWFRVGSRHERPGKTGLAHLFEHLMFNETRNLPAGSFDRVLEAAGGETNAATWVDWTCYYANLPSSELGLIISLESDRMANLVLRESQVVSEKEVVANERRFRVDDSVEGTMNERLYATAFKRHPYGQPTIGWMSDIKAFTTEDCERFYRTYYAPNNATLVLVGDLDEQTALGLIQQRYGSINSERIPSGKPVAEPRQKAERRVLLRRPTPSDRLLLGYRAPAFGDEDYVALTLASEILFGGRSSRVYRRLVRDRELAVEARGSLAPFQQQGLYEIWMVLRRGRGQEQALAALQKEIDRLRNIKVGKKELEKVRNRLELAFLQSLETAAGKAERIGYYETVLGDAGRLFLRRDAYRRTSAADIQRAAQRYLDPRNRTVVIVVPENGGKS